MSIEKNVNLCLTAKTVTFYPSRWISNFIELYLVKKRKRRKWGEKKKETLKALGSTGEKLEILCGRVCASNIKKKFDRIRVSRCLRIIFFERSFFSFYFLHLVLFLSPIQCILYLISFSPLLPFLSSFRVYSLTEREKLGCKSTNVSFNAYKF